MASTREVEWDETERAWMLALFEYRESLCTVCGWPREICRAQDAEHKVEPFVERCWVASRIEASQEAEQANNVVIQQPRGRVWGARLKP